MKSNFLKRSTVASSRKRTLFMSTLIERLMRRPSESDMPRQFLKEFVISA